MMKILLVVATITVIAGCSSGQIDGSVNVANRLFYNYNTAFGG